MSEIVENDGSMIEKLDIDFLMGLTSLTKIYCSRWGQAESV